MTVTKVNVAVADVDRSRFAEVVAALRSAGLHVDREMRRIGVVCGSIETGKLPALRQVQGIRAVEESRSYQLAPPWSDVQ